MLECHICKTKTPALTTCFKCGKPICKKHGQPQYKKVDPKKEYGHKKDFEVRKTTMTKKCLGWLCSVCGGKQKKK